jgi:ribosomal protein S18 acetylase RimI-like enzyme
MREDILFRIAVREDLPAIVHLLADDDLGSRREKDEESLPQSYNAAFVQIDHDPSHQLIVAELNGKVVGTLHLMFLPSISFQGGLRCQVESVRVDKECRNMGIGQEMMKWAVKRARERGAHVIQLTTHLSRKDAHRFYERLGFKGSHLGMKLDLK